MEMLNSRRYTNNRQPQQFQDKYLRRFITWYSLIPQENSVLIQYYLNSLNIPSHRLLCKWTVHGRLV